MYPRKYARVKPAGLVSRQAMIITDPRAPAIPCTLIDYSPGGACVDLGGQVNIPDRFEPRVHHRETQPSPYSSSRPVPRCRCRLGFGVRHRRRRHA